MIPNYHFTLLALLVCVARTADAEPAGNTATQPSPQAHAHNDYNHPRPLLDALDHGFCSVEADVFLVDGRLLVGHDRDELRPERTLKTLYLDPLRERVQANGGHVYREKVPLMLLIDIKADGAAAYQALHNLLEGYAPMLVSTTQGKQQPGAVQVVISGDRPWDVIARQPVRYAGIDGRVADLSDPAHKDLPADLMPLVSDHWSTHFTWTGAGPMPPDQRAKLHRIVALAHQQGRRARFWATPENEAVWSELIAAGVDHVNTDELDRLQTFLLGKEGE